MGLFDLFKKKAAPPPPDEPPPEDPPAHGWDAITAAFQARYPGQASPYHRAPLVYRQHDLSENAAAFDGTSAYDAGGWWHLVSYGLTELYGKEGDDRAVSGFGYELTLRVPKLGDTPPPWAFDFLEAIGKSVWRGMALSAGHTLKTGPLDGRPGHGIDAALVLRDPALPEVLDTPNGSVRFLLLLGVPDALRQRCIAAYEASDGSPGWEAALVEELRAENPDLVTPITHQGEWGE